MNYQDLVDPSYDTSFSSVPNLRWTPWVGRNYSKMESGKRLLIVGESHYAKARPNEPLEALREKEAKNKEYTREVIWECPISRDWGNRTLDNIPLVIVGDGNYRREEFWRGVAFYNFVQRMVNYDAVPLERPTDADFMLGWTVFYDVLKVLRPDYCVFLGSTAHQCFWAAMKKMGADYSDVKRREKVGRCWGYRAGLKIADNEIPLVFIQHPGKCFSPPEWHNYLLREFPSEISDARNRYLAGV